MSFILRKSTTAIAAAALLAGVGLAGSASAAPAQTAYPPYTGMPFWRHTIASQWTHWTPDANTSSHAGQLYAGDNYFYCWGYGQFYSDSSLGRGSRIWLQTDDDTGHRNVWVNAVYLDGDELDHITEITECPS
ncbi:hypothetical protein ABZ622_40315 [Streptomyces sp. NPDC007164]|uniref:hypothetical protein n=1 Tax=Streptomyces sp. NPDC007164 TaxID=3156918 RepID=UPI0033FA2CD8